MENLPFYETFKKFGITLKNQLKNALKSKEWGWIAGYILVLALILIPALGYTLGGVNYLIDASSSIKHKIYPVRIDGPPKTLSYKRLSEKDENNGLWRTLFEITIVYPAGNTNPNAIISTQGIYPEAECEQGTEKYTVEPFGGISTTTKTFLLDCITKEKILDNGQLFGIYN